MKHRLIPLLVLAVVVLTAPAAMAEHCWRCKPLAQDCTVAMGVIPGWEQCYWDPLYNQCVQENECTPHSAALAVQPLAAEYAVASVERLDEPNTTASDTLVASLQPAAPTSR